jgi:hypothetical protein
MKPFHTFTSYSPNIILHPRLPLHSMWPLLLRLQNPNWDISHFPGAYYMLRQIHPSIFNRPKNEEYTLWSSFFILYILLLLLSLSYSNILLSTLFSSTFKTSILQGRKSEAITKTRRRLLCQLKRRHDFRTSLTISGGTLGRLFKTCNESTI